LGLDPRDREVIKPPRLERVGVAKKKKGGVRREDKKWRGIAQYQTRRGGKRGALGRSPSKREGS